MEKENGDFFISPAPNYIAFEPNEPSTIAFVVDDEELMKLTKEGFYYKGEKVEDVHKVYGHMRDWLIMANRINLKEEAK